MTLKPGLDFFAELNAAGNLVPAISNNALVASGETPIRVAWDYDALAGSDSFAGNPPVEVDDAATGKFGGVSVQAISAYAESDTAELSMEYHLVLG